MVAVERGMLLAVRRPWSVAGSEYDGRHLALVVGRGNFRGADRALVVPVTTPGKRYESWWEVNLSGLDSCALPSGLRTVPTSNLRRPPPRLRRYGRDRVADDDLDQVVFVVRSLLDMKRVSPHPEYAPGVIFDAYRPGTDSPGGRWMVLRYNDGNGVAMVMRVGAFHSAVAPLESPILSDPNLAGRCLIVWDVREMSLRHRFAGKVGAVGEGERDSAAGDLVALIAA